MTDKEFDNLLNNLVNLTPEQLERVFTTLHRRFRNKMGHKDMDYAALAWRCKQAHMIIQNRNTPTPTRPALDIS